MIQPVVPGFLRLFFVQIILAVKAAGCRFVRVNHDFAHFAVGHGVAVRVHDVYVILRAGLAHGADLRHGTVQVADGQRRLRLAEALHDLQPRRLFKLAENFRIQRLAGGGHMMDGTEVVVFQIHLDEHSQHRGRRAEGRDIVFFEHRQDVRGVKLVKVIYKHCAFAQPLAVQLAPQGFAPPGIGDCQVQAVPLAAVPVFGRDIVAQGVGMLVLRHLRVAGRSGGEEHERRFISAGSVLRPAIAAGEQRIFRVQVVPALPGAVDHDQSLDRRAFRGSTLGDLGCVAVRRADQRLHAGGVEPVFKIMLLQLVGRRDGDGAELVQGYHGKPELVMPFQHQHHPVAPADPEGGKGVRALVGRILHVLEGEAAFLMVLVHIKHGQLVRILPGNPVHNVKAEVEGLRVREADGGQPALFILFGVDELGGDQVSFFPNGHRRLDRFRLGLGRLPGQDHREENAVLPVHRDHPVRQGGVVVDAVALVQNLRMIADLHLQRAGEHQVKFLASVSRRMDRFALLLFGIFIADPVRFRRLVPEFGRKV